MTSLHVEETGTGERVVLLHSHGMSGGQWRHLTEQLVTRGMRTVAIDLTGQGKSDAWLEPKPFSFMTDVERVVDLVQGAQPAHVVGHSYGGLIAMHVARLAQASIRTLSLFDPVSFSILDADQDRDARFFLAALDLSWAPDPHQRERWLRTFVEFWSGPGAWSGVRDAVRNEFRRVAWVIREGVRTLMEDATPASAFRALEVPTLLLTGEHSPTPARRVIERLARAMPHARSEVVPGVGHLGPVTHPRDVNPRIIAQLAR
jgi:pimeloyl-ACP methyl ester carboxylesterase